MNASQALEYANSALAPQLLFGMDLGGDTRAERAKNEEAISALWDAWLAEKDPGFSFDVVRQLADRNRKLCDGIDNALLEVMPAATIKRQLSDVDLMRSIGALQHRSYGAVKRETKGDRDNFAVAYVSHPVSGTVIGIDIETTGIDPARGHIINVGWEICDLAPGAEPRHAFSVFFGLPNVYEAKGVPAEQVHHISYQMLMGKTQLRQNPKAQKALVKLLTSFPYMAHNAAFEDSWFMLHLDGYAEARKAGKVTPIDTRDICRRIDPEVRTLPREARPATLENWARRRGTLAKDAAEKHLGLEDVDLMLATVLAEFDERNMFGGKS